MGIVSKTLTKRRVAPESGPDNVVADSFLEKGLISAARVRAAMLSRQLDGVSSQTGRGKVSTFAFGEASALWFNRMSDGEWRITLGALNDRNQRTVDWVLEVGPESDSRVAVTTPEYLTSDGVLVNPRVYDAIRSGLLDGFAYQLDSDAGEVTLIEQSLAWVHPKRSVRSGAAQAGPVRLQVHAPATTATDALAEIGIPRRHSAATETEWTLGLGDGHIRLRLETDGTTTTFSGTLAFDEADPFRRACAEQAALAWKDRALLVLRAIDPETRLNWPDAP